MPVPTHLPHVIYAAALTSLTLHLLSARRTGIAARQQADARISVLDGLVTRLRAGEQVSTDELGRIRRLLRESGLEGAGDGTTLGKETAEKNVGWKAAVLGRKDDQTEDESGSKKIS